MTDPLRVRTFFKRILPAPIRRVLRAPITYGQRLGRWGIVLVQIRGCSVRDEMKLLASALAAPFVCWRDLDRWQDPILLFDTQVRVSGIGNFFLRRRTDDLYHVLPHREQALIAALHAQLRPGDFFVDAGANIGIYTVLASRLVGGNGRVLAIEMMPETAAILRRHIECNACCNTRIVEQALADRTGDAVTARVVAGHHGQASIVRTDYDGSVSESTVHTTTLDALLADGGPIRLIKMDLEGAEHRAVQGASEVLDRTHALIFEDWSVVAQSSASVQSILQSRGFGLRRIDGRNWIALRESA